MREWTSIESHLIVFVHYGGCQRFIRYIEMLAFQETLKLLSQKSYKDEVISL
jgi:hypothetical protein